jgi:hypothetical protein
MPRGYGTGPAGMGPMTGRGADSCTGFRVLGFQNFFTGMGLGFWTRARLQTDAVVRQIITERRLSDLPLV